MKGKPKMNVNEMIELLEEIRDNGFGNDEIKLAIQPEYPLEVDIHSINVVTTMDFHSEECQIADNDDDCECRPQPDVIYIASTSATGYTTSAAWGEGE